MISTAIRLTVLCFWLPAASVGAAPTPLTTAREVLALPGERAAEGLAVTITGVVTVAQPDWDGRFFIQDDTAGVFVDNQGRPQPELGDLITVNGITHPGGFAPIVTDPTWEKLGTAPLPDAKATSVDRLKMGLEDSQRIEISGIVRTVREDEFALVLQLVYSGYRLQVIAPPDAVPEPQSLIGARVRLRGTAAASFKSEIRQVIGTNFFVPLAEDLIVEELDPTDPFLGKPKPLRQLAQYDRTLVPGQRILVRGTVTYHRPGQDLFLTDDTGGLQVHSAHAAPIKPGTVVEAVGFPEFSESLPVLEDAVLRITDEPPVPIVPKQVDIADLQRTYHHAELVTLRGKIIDHSIRALGPSKSKSPRELVTLTIQTPEFMFTAVGPASESNAPLAGIPPGSTVAVTGICMLRVDEEANMRSLTLLLPDAPSVRIIKEPSWLTPKRLLTGLALLSGVLVLAFGWIVTISRKNAILKTSIRDKVTAQRELQEAHDLLEERVEERTAQLKFEMNERKETEVRFKATLAERTRLAQELHDTTEQSLTGIGLQLDAAAKLFDQGADDAGRPLEVARTLMTRCHGELRRSIWDLRSRELEQFDLAHALEMSAREILRDTNVKVVFSSGGSPVPLSEIVEENLLRIGREAVSNVLKHAAASQVDLLLEFAPASVVLCIRDDGRGFHEADAPGSEDGHFGLLGMAERAKHLQGELQVHSTPGGGTTVEVRIPVKATIDRSPATASSQQA